MAIRKSKIPAFVLIITILLSSSLSLALCTNGKEDEIEQKNSCCCCKDEKPEEEQEETQECHSCLLEHNPALFRLRLTRDSINHSITSFVAKITKINPILICKNPAVIDQSLELLTFKELQIQSTILLC